MPVIAAPCPECASTDTRPVDGRGDGLMACGSCWATFTDPTQCATCRKEPATAVATRDGERWPVGARCIAVARRHRAQVTHEQIATPCP